MMLTAMFNSNKFGSVGLQKFISARELIVSSRELSNSIQILTIMLSTAASVGCLLVLAARALRFTAMLS